MRRALGLGVGAGAALAAAMIWGCASAPAPSVAAPASAQHDWQHYEPDGGWANYVPAPETSPQAHLDTATGTTPHSGFARSTPSMTRMSPGP